MINIFLGLNPRLTPDTGLDLNVVSTGKLPALPKDWSSSGRSPRNSFEVSTNGTPPAAWHVRTTEAICSVALVA